METRKVQQVGGGTYTVSIPIGWAEEHAIEAGEPVHLYSHMDGSLVLRYREKDHCELAAATIQLESDSPAAAERTIEAAYTAGFKRITLTAADEFTDDQTHAIDEAVRALSGVDIAEQTPTQTIIKALLDARNVSIQQSLRQLQFVALSMHEAASTAFAGETTETEYIFQRDDEADRIFQLIHRHFNRSLVAFEALNQLDVTRQQLCEYFRTARQLERVADHAAKMAGVVERMRTECSIEQSVLAEVAALAADARAVVETASDAVLNQATATEAHAALDRRDEVITSAADIDEGLRERPPEGAYLLTRVLDSIVRTAKYGGNIATIAIQRSIETGAQSQAY